MRIFAFLIISLTRTPINTSKLAEIDYNRKPKIVNAHRVEPDISSNGTDIYSDGFTQQRRLNPQPKIRVHKVK